MKKTLRNIVGGLGLLTLVAGCSSGEFYHEASPIFNLMPRVIQPGGHRDYVERNSQNNQGMSNEDRMMLNQIKSTPRIICLGDVDNDGDVDGIYYDGRGNKYWAVMGFDNDRGVTSLTKSKEFYKMSFGYITPKGCIMKVPENILVIWDNQSQKYK